MPCTVYIIFFPCFALQPVNIFLDSEDHVKIGDFGLATSSPLNTSSFTTTDVLDGGFLGTVSTEKSSEVVSSSGQLTGQIGTALYVAPELKTVSSCKLLLLFDVKFKIAFHIKNRHLFLKQRQVKRLTTKRSTFTVWGLFSSKCVTLLSQLEWNGSKCFQLFVFLK